MIAAGFLGHALHVALDWRLARRSRALVLAVGTAQLVAEALSKKMALQRQAKDLKGHGKTDKKPMENDGNQWKTMENDEDFESFGSMLGCQLRLMRLCCIVPLVAASCLPDAIPESARKDLVQGDEHYAVGLWVNNWPAGEVAVELVRIIVQDSF